MKHFFLLFAASFVLHTSAQVENKTFRDLATKMPTTWYGTSEALAAADSCLKYQFPSGGWGKNQDWQQQPSGAKLKERMELARAIKSSEGIGSTIDNNATTTELLFLAKVYAATQKPMYRQAFLKGLHYLFEAQYANGGWPQFYPFKHAGHNGKPPYSNHITFNDNAMYNVMTFLDKIARNSKPFDTLHLQDSERQQARQAYQRGISCILNTQVVKNGVPTVWCQQHDEFTLRPAPARSFELVSLTGCGETASLVRLLMKQKNPSDSIIRAVKGAVAWLQAHVLADKDWEYFTNSDGKGDRRIGYKKGHNLWARYYDIDTEEPFVCDRDGIKKKTLEEIGYERRNGYRWYDDDPETVLKAYPEWLARVTQKH